MVTVDAARRLRGDQRVDDRLLGRLDGREEQGRDELVVKQLDRTGARGGSVLDAEAGGRRERDRVIAAAVRCDAAGLGQSHEGALAKPPEVARVERGVGGDDDDARAVGVVYIVAERELPQCLADGNAVDLERAAEVALHERADRVSAQLGRQDAGGRADPAFESEAHRPRPGADAPFLDRAGPRITDGCLNMGSIDVPPADVVQPAVVRLTDERVHRSYRFVALGVQRVVDERLDGRRDGERVRKDDRRLNRPQLVDLRRAGEFAESVADVNRARDLPLKQITLGRDDGGDTGADQVAFAQRRVAYLHASDVRNRVMAPRLHDADAQANVAGATGLIGLPWLVHRSVVTLCHTSACTSSTVRSARMMRYRSGSACACAR